MSEQIHDFLDFGPFRLDRVDRLLWRGGQVVPLTPKAIDLLVVLADSDGRVLSKRELVDMVWPDTFVGRPTSRIKCTGSGVLSATGRMTLSTSRR